jgi:cytochrome c peroxidase
LTADFTRTSGSWLPEVVFCGCANQPIAAMKKNTPFSHVLRSIATTYNIGVMLTGVMCVTMGGCTEQEKINTSVPDHELIASLGRKIFFDKQLSASGEQSCATCHDPSHAYAPANDLAVQLGGPKLDQQGARAVPSLRYTLNKTPAWHQPYVASMGERIREGIESPTGGFGWDGRFSSLHEQANFPLMAANEMANRSVDDVSNKLAHAGYAAQFRQAFGENIFDSPQIAYNNALKAVEQFEMDDESFHPYTSKYDDVLEGKAELSAAELRGLSLFNDPTKGNCASCHIAIRGQDGSHPLFTNFQFEALGVPRNREIQANADELYYDRGVCGPTRTALNSHPELCGLFKAPSLRNVASRGAFFHNGYFHTLKSALEFYVQRDTDPLRWYPHQGKHVIKFDDLPPDQRANINVIDLPMNNTRGAQPIWNAQDIDDVVAFLKTLTDRDVINR